MSMTFELYTDAVVTRDLLTIAVTAVPASALKPLWENEVFSVRRLASC